MFVWCGFYSKWSEKRICFITTSFELCFSIHLYHTLKIQGGTELGLRDSAVICWECEGRGTWAVVCWSCEAWGTQQSYVENVRVEGLSCHTPVTWRVSSHSHYYKEDYLVQCVVVQCGRLVHNCYRLLQERGIRHEKNLQWEIRGWWGLGPEVNQWELCKIKSDPVAFTSITLVDWNM
jgi:hypothetical protein